MTNVMLIGDSIRMNYGGEAERCLGDAFKVYAPPENCRFARYVLNSVRFWINEMPAPDVVHFNAGIWDIGRTANYKEDAPFTELDEYVRDVALIAEYFLGKGVKVIFATTTPVKPVDDSDPSRDVKNADIDRYNAAAVAALKPLGVAVNDLNAFVKANAETYISGDKVHLSEEGIKACGAEVADFIKASVS